MKRLPSVCVVGSGPAGIYTAKRLEKHCRVTVLEAALLPGGLLRTGVSPFHAELRRIGNTASLLCGVRVHGNHADIQQKHANSVSLDTLRSLYSAVVFCVGSSAENVLSLPTAPQNIDNCEHVITSRKFVSWYNSDLHSTIAPEIPPNVLIIGHGNVSLDVASILLSPHQTLSKTDISKPALSVLKTSNVTNVSLVARRGPLQSQFTTSAFRSLLKSCARNSDLNITTDVDLILREMNSHPEVAQERPRKRLLDLILKSVNESQSRNLANMKDSELAGKPTIHPKTLNIVYNSVPVRLNLTFGNKLKSVTFKRTELVYSLSSEAVKVHVLDKEYEIECELVITCIGYKNTKLDGLPFDNLKNVINNRNGRVINEENESIMDGLYVAGWIKTGPTGVIGILKIIKQKQCGMLTKPLTVLSRISQG